MADCDELTACSQRPLALGYATHVSYHTDMRNAIFLMFGLKRPSAPTKITVWRPEVGEFEGSIPSIVLGTLRESVRNHGLFQYSHPTHPD